MEYNKLVNDLYNELMHRVKMYIKDSKKIYLIERAFSCAFEGHKDKKRHSGEPYIVHPLCVALILSKTPLIKDADIIAACLLHDVVEDCGITVEELRLHFNDDVAMLVDGVSKISREELPHTTKEERDDINKAKILMSMIKDIRVMYIKLADRLHNSRTFMYLPYDKQIENANETLTIYAPIANYIGAYDFKCELEDNSLKYLNPESYGLIKEQLQIFNNDNSSYINDTLIELSELLDFSSTIIYQNKNIYDIYKRLERYKRIEDIPNLMAFKIICRNENICYEDLKKIVLKYPILDEWYKNYIASPKTNLYQSLHISFINNDNKIVQTQLRTESMDDFTKYGISSYIGKNNYKENIQNKLKTLQFYETLCTLKDAPTAHDFIHNVKNDILTRKVYVYDENGSVFELPVGSTPIDFAYHIYPNLENQLIEAYVNGKKVLPGYILKSNDLVEIKIKDVIVDPIDTYAPYIKTMVAKNKIIKY